LNPLKGAGFALDVLARLEGRIPLVVVGEGLEREPMERRARDQGLDVRFLPWLANHDVLRVMKRASLVIVPSRWPEPLSRVILEAMAVGVPVVASDRGGVHDQLENGLSGLVLPLDPSAFAGGITTLLADDSRRERMIEAARGRVRSHFHRSAVLPRIEMLYDEVRRRAPRGGC
jgi:glycosyltransferase involved in cell wall biosynthesis